MPSIAPAGLGQYLVRRLAEWQGGDAGLQACWMPIWSASACVCCSYPSDPIIVDLFAVFLLSFP